MTAFNTIKFVSDCPNCGKNSQEFSAQCHVAARYGTNENGTSLACRDYRMGQKMSWFSPRDSEYSLWRLPDELPQFPDHDDVVLEICEATCANCGSDDFGAVILFEALTPTRVVALGPNSELRTADDYINILINEKTL